MGRHGLYKDSLAIRTGDILVLLFTSSGADVIPMEQVIKTLQENDAVMTPPVTREYDPDSIKHALDQYLVGAVQATQKEIHLDAGWTPEDLAESVKILHKLEGPKAGENSGRKRESK